MRESVISPSRPGIALEICVDTPDGLAVAARAGADRCELCAALDLGGLTPGPGLIAAGARAGVPVHARIRPRAGDFIATEADLLAMIADIAAIRAAGLAGVVIGVATGAGALDIAALEPLVRAAGPLEVTLHRVIDLAPDPLAALEAAIGLGIGRILTSGGAPAAPDGAERIARMVRQAAGRIEIMAGGGVTPASVPALLATGVDALHASCAVSSGGEGFGFGRTRRTDAGRITALKRAMTPQGAPA